MVPARISSCGQNLELYRGEHSCNPSWNPQKHRWEVPKGVMYAAWLPMYQSGKTNPAPNSQGPVIDDTKAVKYPGGGIPQHGDEIRETRRQSRLLAQFG